METIAQLISTIGFPCAMCVYLIWAHKKESEKTAESTAKLATAVNGLTTVVTVLETMVENYFHNEKKE